MFQNISFAFNI